MNKNVIKNYALKILPEEVIEFANKEKVKVTIDEAKLFVNTVKEKIDYILDGHALDVLKEIKDKISLEAYDLLKELLDKYSKYINK